MKIAAFFSIFALVMQGFLHLPTSTHETAEPVRPLAFIGTSYKTIYESFGEPDSVGVGLQGNLDFTYTASGIQNDPTFLFHEGVVIWVNPKAKLNFKRKVNPDPVWLGQSVEELAKKFGQPESYSVGQITTTLKYKNGPTVAIAKGIVVGIKGRS